jgi:hypothetical protein
MTKQASGEVVMHYVQRTTLENGRTVMTEICRVFNDVFRNQFFNNFIVLKCGFESVFKRSAWVGFK